MIKPVPDIDIGSQIPALAAAAGTRTGEREEQNMYCITKWTKHITDSGKDEYTGRFEHMKQRLADELASNGNTPIPVYDFRLLDDDGVIYAYGKSTRKSFGPLDKYQPLYGCTEIQYRNPETKKYETL